MTTASSEDSIGSSAPRIFHVPDQIADHMSTYSDSPNVHRCPLCKKFKKVFFCKDCVQSGLYTNREDGINSIRKTLSELKENRQNVERNCLKSMDNRHKYYTLQMKVRQGKERNRIIRLALDERRQKRHFLNQKLSILQEQNKERTGLLESYKNKLESFEDYVQTKNEDVIIAKQKLGDKYVEIKRLARLRVQQLFKLIFPITVVKPIIEMESSGDSTAKELAEASETTLIKDKWVYTDYSNEMHYSVVTPCLNGSGNYSNYMLWAQNRDGIPISDPNSVEANPTVTISAALTYTAQLVNVLSFLLNVRLPFKLIYSEFSNTMLSEKQFSKKVARLNANILYLCISQNIDINTLNSTATIQNLLQLRDNKKADLGRQGPIEFNENQVRALEKSISADLKSTEDSDSDEGDSFEWEALPNVKCPEASPGPATVQSSVLNAQQTSSVAGGLMNSAVASVASIWRGFTGR